MSAAHHPTGTDPGDSPWRPPPGRKRGARRDGSAGFSRISASRGGTWRLGRIIQGRSNDVIPRSPLRRRCAVACVHRERRHRAASRRARSPRIRRPRLQRFATPAAGSPAPVAHAPRFVPREPHDTVVVVSQPAPVVRPTPIVVASTPRPSPVVSRPIAHYPSSSPSRRNLARPSPSLRALSSVRRATIFNDRFRRHGSPRAPSRRAAPRVAPTTSSALCPARPPPTRRASRRASRKLSSPSHVVHMSRPHAQPVALRPVAVHPVVLRPSPALNRATSAENL